MSGRAKNFGLGARATSCFHDLSSSQIFVLDFHSLMNNIVLKWVFEDLECEGPSTLASGSRYSYMVARPSISEDGRRGGRHHWDG